jgi:GNAT superfamily N-acetyltransferase
VADSIAVRALRRDDLTAWQRLWDDYNEFYGRTDATALIGAVYGRAREAGVDSVYWQTYQSNAVAMRLYDKLATRFGFIVYDKVL